MTMKEIVYSALSDDAILNAYGVNGQNTYSSNVKSNYDEKFFVIIRWGFVSQRLTSQAPNGKQFVSIWVHDKQRDTNKIDRVIRRIFDILTNLKDISDADGRVTQIDWQGDSEEGYDDQFGTTTRSTDYVIIGR